MNWAYQITFNGQLCSRDELTKFLDSVSDISYWYTCLPFCVFFSSSLTAQEISDKIKTRFESYKVGGRFLVTEVHKDRQGWLPPKAWKIFKDADNPKGK